MQPDQPTNQPQPAPQTDDKMFGPPFQQPTPGAVVSSANPPQPGQPQPASANDAGGGPSPKKPWLLAWIIVGVLLICLLVGVMIMLAANNSKKPAATSNSNSSNSQDQGPTAATSSSVQLSNDSISQDLSSLNDDKDLPADRLTDQNLGL